MIVLVSLYAGASSFSSKVDGNLFENMKQK